VITNNICEGALMKVGRLFCIAVVLAAVGLNAAIIAGVFG
jgi:predicted RecA/RadA family phage recombinase